MEKRNKTKQLTALAMLCAIAYVLMLVCRIPVVYWLKYDPKDIVIALGGMIWGPAAACITSVLVSAVEMVTVSETGLWGFLMNVLSTCSFACTAALIYKRRQTLTGAVLGLLAGGALVVVSMLLWNYLVTPFYMGQPREAVVKLLLPVFLPFNLLKAGLNAVGTFLLYKPLVTALRKVGVIPQENSTPRKNPVALWIACALVLAACVLEILILRGIL